MEHPIDDDFKDDGLYKTFALAVDGMLSTGDILATHERHVAFLIPWLIELKPWTVVDVLERVEYELVDDGQFDVQWN